MGNKRTWAEYWREGWVSAIVVGLVSLWLWARHDPGEAVAENGWARSSYDWAYWFRPGISAEDFVIVAMDEVSFREFGFGMDTLWPRSLHARLLTRLKEDGARLAVFDVWFNDPGLPQDNETFARAIRDHGRVVLAAVLSPMNTPGLAGQMTMLPRREFLTNALAWGISELYQDPDGVSREIFCGTEQDPGLSWAAAQCLAPDALKAEGDRRPRRWLNYYGPARHLSFVSYAQAFHQPAGFFADKIVIIGAQNQTLRVGEENDEFPTPYNRWESDFASGPEIIATSIRNLARGEWLRRMSPTWEGLLILASGLGLGLGLSRWPPAAAFGISVLAAFLICAGAVYGIWTRHLWFSWMVIVGFQVPAAWVGAVLIHMRRVRSESQFLRRTLDETISEIRRPTTLDETPRAGSGTPRIPDHELLRRVGRGAYGEVWLARNTIGMFHAVKIVHRDSFADDGPYEREFRGIQKYMPVSRSHPGLVNILHVGRNDNDGYFFYIMEAADDEVTGITIDPNSYRPRSLATVLAKGPIPSLDGVLTLMVALTGALEALHRQKLVHRDIKPSNIIFLNGVPMFADIGLVTDLASQQHQVSIVGTRGYMPPEGPGTAAADVFSLGKVMYQVTTGMDPEMFPELPTDFMDRTDFQDFKELNVVMGRACDSEPNRRYQSAGEIHEALLRLQFKWQGRKGSSP